MTAITTAVKKHKAPERISQQVLDLKNPDRSIREDAAQELASNGTPENGAELCSLLYDDDISVRNLAAEVLVKMGQVAAPALLEEAKSTDGDVRKFVVDTMAFIGMPEFVPTLVKLLDDSNENVVGSAAEALGRIKDQAAVTSLINCQKAHPLAELQIIEALGNIGSNHALPLLYQKMHSDNVVLVYAAVEAVGKIATTEALDKLFSLLDVKNMPLRNVVLSTILKMAVSGNRKELYNASGGKFVDYLIEAANSDDANIRGSIIRELAFWSGEKVVSALITALNDTVPDIVNLAQGALRMNGDSGLVQIIDGIKNGNDITKRYLIEVSAFLKSFELLDIILAQANSPVPDVRMACAIALSKYNNLQAVQTLLKLADDEVGHVRAEALKSIGLLGNKTIVDKIYHRLNDEYPDVREACLAALILINGKLTVSLFKNDIEGSDISRRVMAVRALGWIGEADAADVLLDALGNDVAEVRRYAVLGLSKINDSRLEESLPYLLADENPEVRKAVVNAYLQNYPDKAIEKIKVLLDDSDLWVRFYAVNALSSISDASCLDKLLEIVHQQPPFIQIAIIGILSRSNEERADAGLISLAKSDNDDIRQVAREALEARNAAR